MYIKRHMERVVERLAKRKAVVVVVGARQVGKSTMLKEIFKDMHYVSMDSPLVRESACSNPSMFFEMHRPPVIVDEVQKAAQLFEYVKVVADTKTEKGLFFLTGSQSLKLMANASESLAGRAGIVKMLGLSSRELDGQSRYEPFLPKYAMESTAGFDSQKIVERIHMGGFPELYEAKGSLKDWQDFYDSYFQTYIEKDIKDVLKIQDESAFIRFVRATASLTAEMLNYSTLAEICGKDIKTVQKWLSVLESCGLVYILQPYYNNFSKRLVKMPKLYFLDTGLACRLLGWNTPDQMFNGAMWGKMFETHVVCEVLKSYYNDGNANPPLYYYRDKDKVEVDLVIEEGNTLYPVEIKATSDPSKSMAAAFGALHRIPAKTIGQGAVVCMCNQVLPLADGVWALPANAI